MEARNNRPVVAPRPRQAQKAGEEMLSLLDIWEIFTSNWKWFLISIVGFVGLARLYLATQNYVFQRQAVMLVKDDSGSGGSRKPNISTDALMQLNGVLSGTSVKNEVYILHSYQLMQEVVKKLHLDVTYSCKSGLKKISLYKNGPITVDFLNEFDTPVIFQVEILNGKEGRVCEVRYGNPVKDSDYEKVIKFGELIKAPFGEFVIAPVVGQMKEFVGRKITVTRMSLEDATIVNLNKVSTSEMDKESTLVRLVCNDTNIQRADDILNGLLEAYKQSIIQDKNQMAQSTSDFIENRIRLIKDELNEVEGQLANFKRESGMIDVKSTSEAFLNQSTSARQRTIQAETQYSMVQYLVDYLNQNIQANELVPSMGGINDNGIQTQINQFNQLMLTRNRLADNTSADSPALREMDNNLAQMRTAMIASLKGYTASLKLQVERAHAEENALSGNISTVPQKEKEGIDIARQQAIKETLYTYLLNKREETALQLAITEANIRIVEHPFGGRTPIAPRKLVISLAALLLGIIVPFVFFYIRTLLNTNVRGRKDVETFTTIPILGEIPHRKAGIDDAEIIVAEQKDDVIGEAFRMLRFSMSFINKEARVIMFTSTMPGEGKTFISRNFAATLGMTGKRVVLVDTDIRKRTQSRLSAMGRREGLTSFLSGATDDVQSLCVPQNAECHLDFMPAGITPPNPAELLMSDRLELCIEKLKEIYDYIIVDNVPAQVVADAGIVNRVADMTIYVIRESKVDRRFLPELERLHQEGKFNHLCVVINDTMRQHKKYGYGYGYGYGYKEEGKKTRLFKRS